MKLNNRNWFVERGVNIPVRAWSEGRNRKPIDFVPTAEGMNTERTVTEGKQEEWFNGWLEGKYQRGVWVIGSEPDDAIALHWAALMVQARLANPNRGTRPAVWLNWGACADWVLGERELNPEMGVSPCMLIVGNLSPNSNRIRLERTRDWVFHWSGIIPVVLVVAGLDPLSMAATKLYVNANAVRFHSSKVVKRRLEVL